MVGKILAIIDLDTNREHGHVEDQMIVDNSERTKIARTYADQFRQREQTSAFFSKLFDPEFVKLDTIEEGALTFLSAIESHGASIVYLTSRPHTMKAETEHWLTTHGVSHPCFFKYYGTGERGLDGKPDVGDRYIKTSVWKANEVTRIINQVETEMGEAISWVIFVDDEEANRIAVSELHDPRILIRCNLEDAATHDFQRDEIGQNE